MDVKLIYSKDNGATKDIPLTAASTIIGRAKDCDLRIPIESCSRRQCELILENETLTLRDLNSSNGTVVNNTPSDEVVLSPGDRITIGPVTLTVCIDGVSASSKPQAPAPVKAKQEELVSDTIDEVPVVEAPGAALTEDDDEDIFAIISEDKGASDADPLASLGGGGGPDLDDDDPLAALAGLGGGDAPGDDFDVLASLADEDDADDDDPLAALQSLSD